MRTFTACQAAPGPSLVKEARATSAELGVSVTPTFFVGRLLGGGRVQMTGAFTGAQPLEHFVKLIEEALVSQ